MLIAFSSVIAIFSLFELNIYVCIFIALSSLNVKREYPLEYSLLIIKK